MIASTRSASIRIIGFGMGPQHVTPEAADALRSCDYVVAAAKSADDPLLAVRRQVCEEYGVELVAVPDPERDRDPASTTATAGYDQAVREWHAARVAAYRDVLEQRGGTAGFLVWGDPSLYDSTIRIVEQLGFDFDVIPGISAPQLLAARHRIVLHEVGRPVHVTTARRLREDIATGQTNLVVMLGSAPDLEGLEDWQVWYGANLGAPGEQLLSGRLGELGEASLRVAREHARAIDGWVMDLYLLRGPR
ncbi:precorrin-6A synthase (deacetylating) [Nocardioides sp. Iso805N]|uniref:precorrin-6A synthase (deacetylating) n=1 Tax=Nocardioides sp. Iso805N TaxID=1283287 RepID=UPI0003785740|nr:precorrin-6A synthase (deacetylating) [Nocardioides sp. Iso805N]